jgi:hypothetical protein
MPEHVGARTRWRDNIPRRFLENFDRMLGNRARVSAQAGIERGLSATGLLTRKFHTNAEALENVHYGFTRLREDGIDKTGDEELNGGHESILSENKNAPDFDKSGALL